MNQESLAFSDGSVNYTFLPYALQKPVKQFLDGLLPVPVLKICVNLLDGQEMEVV